MSASVQLRPPPAEAEANGAPPPPKKRRRLVWALLATAAGAGIAVAVWMLADVGGRDQAEAAGTVATATAEVARRDLAQTETFTGTLGYSDTRTLASNAAGTITALAPEGSTRGRGEVLYRVDQRAVILLIGDLPPWRRLEIGIEGRDVLQLEQNLKRLGYDPGAVDREYDSDTATAVQSWQEDWGLEETGAVELGSVVFSPGPVRIGSHLVAAGQGTQPGGQVLQVSATTQVVTVQLDVADRSLVAEGDEVVVELPDETEAPGTIADIGTVAEATTDEQTGESTGSTVEVTIELSNDSSTNLDQASVDVSVVTDSTENALAVPVTALVALLGGGYAVEVPDGEATRLVAVEPGMYADGYVEIAGGELAEGETVVVPQ